MGLKVFKHKHRDYITQTAYMLT